ncbi:MAG: YdiU family protein [Bacteroidota bacterium]
MSNHIGWNLQHTYHQLPAALFSEQEPVPVKVPETVLFNSALAQELGLAGLQEQADQIQTIFSGNQLPPGSQPLAQAYAGHQFGHFTMLGDGRAVLLGEQVKPDGGSVDIQLKGSGRTPYSRRGDGRATVSSMLREYIMSEAMHHLGIPTSRSLAVVKTGEKIYREPIQEGAVLTRIASSHIRVGTFEYVRQFTDRPTLEAFLDYVIQRHYPELAGHKNPALALVGKVMERQLELVVQWLRVGFIHGVMNTDNMSIAGETIDYGPCAFMNAYDPKTVYSSIDRNARYAFGNQANITYWNLAVLANALLPLFATNQEKGIELAKEVLEQFPDAFAKRWYHMLFQKIGIAQPQEGDKVLIDNLLELLQNNQVDYTNAFAALTWDRLPDQAFFHESGFQNWKASWEARLAQSGDRTEAIALMKRTNPVTIARNHLVEEALDAAVIGNLKPVEDLLERLKTPYAWREFQGVPEGFDVAYQTFCGT